MIRIANIFNRSHTKLVYDRRFSSVPESIHPSQIASMGDSLIRVNENDDILGPIPKLESHLGDAIKSGIIHRAFSVFLFSKETSSLLIQKRCSSKIVFPREWANTCCSHPLFTESEMENESGNQIGIKRAAVKRLGAELGIAGVNPKDLSFREKILYRQLSPGGIFGESECDYILIGELSEKNDSVVPNEDEVEEFQWIQPGPAGDRTKSLREFLEKESLQGFPPTPWFGLMVKDPDCLERWWSQLLADRASFFAAVPRSKIRNFLSVEKE